MAEAQAFRGWRYNLAQVGELSDVVAPPYDVIGPQEQRDLYEKHACNVIRLILNRDEPGDESTDAKYGRAANFLRRWISDGVVQQERTDALYVYHQEFEWEARRYVRKGFLGRIRLAEFGKGKVFPHEETMSGPKADRLALTKACKMNLSPIFGLYPDEAESVQTPLEKAIQGVTPLEARDRLGVIHRMWPLTDTAAIHAATEQLLAKPIFIADGHHRYETALHYRRWLEAEGRLKGPNDPANFVLMMFVGMSDPGLAILPTHRLVSGLPDLTAADVKSALDPFFEVQESGSGDAGARETWELIEADGGQDVLGFGTVADGKWLLARLKDREAMARLVADRSPEWRGLGVSILHRLALDHAIKQKYPNAELAFKYVHLLDEVTEAQAARQCQLGCLVPPARINHVAEIASKLEKMPPKSTYFYPKLLSGLVFHGLE